MQKQEFDLIYKLDSPADTYLAPRLLPNTAPEEARHWQRQGAISFRFRYPFMPSGLINRLIVRLCGSLKEDGQGSDLAWRDGAILQQNGSTALIKQDRTSDGLDVIDISVHGKPFERKGLLAHIRRTLTGLHHDSFKDLNLEELVPCCCENCAKLPEPSFFEFTTLQRYIDNERTEITCANENSVQDVSIVQLLEGVVERRSEYGKPMRQGERLQEDPFPQVLSNLKINWINFWRMLHTRSAK